MYSAPILEEIQGCSETVKFALEGINVIKEEQTITEVNAIAKRNPLICFQPLAKACQVQLYKALSTLERKGWLGRSGKAD